MKRLICILLILCTTLLAACAPAVITPDGVYTTRLEPADTPTNFVQIELENGGIIVVELYPDIAPKTVENFLKVELTLAPAIIDHTAASITGIIHIS